MAGQVRQPIDIASLERYVAENVPEIKVPLDVKQVWAMFVWTGLVADEMAVRIWTVKPDVSIDGQEWEEVCHEKEASGPASFKGTDINLRLMAQC